MPQPFEGSPFGRTAISMATDRPNSNNKDAFSLYLSDDGDCLPVPLKWFLSQILPEATVKRAEGRVLIPGITELVCHDEVPHPQGSFKQAYNLP